MRLVTSVQVAIGIAASGGVALMLSGTALAADSGVSSGSQSSDVSKTVSSQVQNVTSSGSSDVLVVNSQDQASSGSQKVGSSVSDTESRFFSEGEVKAQTATTSDASSVTADGAAAGSTKTTESKGLAAVFASEASGTAVPGVSNYSKKSEIVPVLSQDRAVHTVAFHSEKLVIQPTITNRTSVLAEDLAATVPSATLPARAPEPVQAAGLLSSLTTQLASTTLPPLFVPVAPVALAMALVVSLVTLTLLMVGLMGMTYGAWMRRAGFATAARSDADAVQLSFATPRLLGQHGLRTRTSDPIFSGVRNEGSLVLSLVFNAFRKEEMS